MMKKLFIEPSAELVLFCKADVIATSSDGGMWDYFGDFGFIPTHFDD